MDTSTKNSILAGIVPALLAVFFLTLYFRRIQSQLNVGGLPLPPGPPQLPLIGNALDVKADEPWLTYTKWRDQYGDIVRCRLPGSKIILIGSEKVADDLLEKRSRKYSSRPHFATRAAFGWDFHFAWEGYGDKWRVDRRLFQQSFREEMTMHYHPFLLRASQRLLLNISKDTNNLFDYLALFAGSAMLSSIYGYETNDINDSFFRTGEDALVLLEVLTPEKSVPLELFPFVPNLPDWFPGVSLQRHARSARKILHEYVERPYQFTLKSLTSSTLLVFVLAMVLHPDVQRRAQEELEAIVGNNRLPTLEDRPSLPYLGAVIREVMRWHPVVPLAIGHATVEDDVYENYFIPKGYTIIPNTWAISRDSTKYPDPETFNPDRFLNADGKLNGDSVKWNFGWGRRICPGRHIAEAGVWLAAARLLATFSFLKPKDRDGRDVDFEPKWTSGVTSHPVIPFPCHVVPRDPSLIMSVLEAMVLE
ncbi:cytochrome P450 [Coniophora puteana RWD-64-598 SS2]|uniref:Cytochrome P450 n=1 Tax=Coniophora puteana (strain RWD-64-598) TaxID=741705 RepID=A0A5M3MXX3_CONPW|nr:cytochrome P450 [Coniophora puteana RWD-64-598 SS2]EIW83949.1 cytochrome P450 [Coniophora puteana RWD-64-598 SS2]